MNIIRIGSYMKNITAIAIFLSMVLASSSANAFFFFFLPGSVTGKIADAFTGSEGENCVGPNAKVGDPINLNGTRMTVKSLSGTSSRCNNPEMPIRAMLEPSSDVVTQSTSQAKIDLPDGWEVKPMSDAQKLGGTVLLTYNRTIDSWLQIATAKRSGITDMNSYANTRKAIQIARMQDAKASDITELNVGGLRAWRFDVVGKFNKIDMTISKTLLESSLEVVSVEAWTTTTNYPRVQETLMKIVSSVSGLPISVDLAKEEEARKTAAEAEVKRTATEQEDAKRLATEAEVKRVAAEREEEKRLTPEEDRKQIKPGTLMKISTSVATVKQSPEPSTQVDFNAEARKAARILGCQPSELKVSGIESGNILYSIVCDGSKAIKLSCDPSGLCLQKKSSK